MKLRTTCWILRTIGYAGTLIGVALVLTQQGAGDAAPLLRRLGIGLLLTGFGAFLGFYLIYAYFRLSRR